MKNADLTGIERQLVLQYLIDGNVPVTVTLYEQQNDNDEKHTLPVIFPVALQAEQIVVSDIGIILLKNPPDAVKNFAGKQVKVEFYFNRMGLYFVTEMKDSEYGLALVVPEAIQRVEDDDSPSKYDFTAMLYFSCQNKKNMNIECLPVDGYKLFSRPVWSSIAIEQQQEAKHLLERIVVEAKQTKNAGNGIQLIPVCKYLVEKEQKIFEAVEGRVKPLGILYVDHERIVLAAGTKTQQLFNGSEYAVKMSFRIKDGPILSRDIFATCVIAKIYTVGQAERYVADCAFTSIHEEDVRFLYEKATSKLFI